MALPPPRGRVGWGGSIRATTPPQCRRAWPMRGRLTPALASLLVLGLAFVLYTQVVGTGATGGLDLRVARAGQALWRPALQPLAQGVAILGGIEASAVGAAGPARDLGRGG